uniref:MAGUK p55 subfamily member 6 n=1 Tax=Panagrolaimus superbus TaxID=310955 RepID=A0A914Z2M3_9BILA
MPQKGADFYLIDAYDEISKQQWNVALPEIPTDFDSEYGCAVKIVQLVKGSEALGATIKYTPEGSVFISRLIVGGAAEKSGLISVGDRIISINGISVDNKDPNDIAVLLNSSENSTVTFKLAPTALRKCLPTDQLKNYKYVKALIDYDPKNDPSHPCPDAGLSFEKGTILEVIHIDDKHWMQAKFVDAVSNMPSAVGIIPSDEKLSLDDNNITFENNKNRLISNGYESVCQLAPKSGIIRTLVLIGPPGVGRNELKRRLILQKPQKYAATVPHTSRPPRPHEKDGIDYNFVSRQQMKEWIHNGRFIESGEYNGNLYGTLDDAILTVISKKQIPIINAHPSALKSLRSSRFMPLTIFIAPPDLTVLKKTRALNKSDRKFNDNDLEQMIIQSKQLEQMYGQFFDAKIINDNLNDAFETLCSILHNFETLPSWIPLEWVKNDIK